MKSLQLFLFCVIITSCSFSQEKSVFIELNKKLKEFPSYFKVSDRGIVVKYTSTQSKMKYSNSYTSYTFKYFDKDLNEIWTTKNFENGRYSYDDKNSNIPKLQETISIDPEGKYIYFYEGMSRNIYKINVSSGDVATLKIDENILFKDYKLYGHSDKQYFYTIFTEENKSRNRKNENNRILIVRINKDNMNYELYKIELPNPGKLSGNVSRYWIAKGARNGIIYFMDNYTVTDKDTKNYFRRFICIDINNNVVADKYIKLGDKIADGSHRGDIIFNKFNDGMLYTYSWSRTDGKNILVYACYDEYLKGQWQKEYPSGVRSGTVQKGMGRAHIYNIDNSILITSYYGSQKFIFKYDIDKDKFDFKSFKAKKICDFPSKYRMDCGEYLELSEDPQVESFLLKDMENCDVHMEVSPIYMDDRIFIAKKSTINFSLKPRQFISIDLLIK